MTTLSFPLLLAQGSNTGTNSGALNPLDALEESATRLDILNHPNELLGTLQNLGVIWGSIFLVIGIICILNGYRWHKWVIVACAFLGGVGLGHLLAQQMGESKVAMMAIGLLCAVVATPMLRVTTAIFAGLTGAFIGANVWTAFAAAPEQYMAGAGMGFIAFALASFLLFKWMVVAFTSIGGGALAVLGAITLLLSVPSWQDSVTRSLSDNHLITLLVAVAAATGFVMQHQAALGSGGGEKAAH